jgi:carbon-monoxide dehydrogenase medium subunit
MLPPAVAYERPTSAADAVSLLADDPDATVIAGGQGLLPDLKRGDAAPGTLVDLAAVPGLRGVDPGDPTTVGALTTLATLADSDPVRSRAPSLWAALGHTADQQLRNRATIGGNLADGGAGRDPPAALLAADARVAVRGPDGERVEDAATFFATDHPELGNTAFVTELHLPAGPRTAGGYARRTHPETGYAVVGVASSLAVADGRVTQARVAAAGATDRPTRLTAVEDALVDAPATRDAAADAAASAGESVLDHALVGDRVASSDYRRSILGPYAERSLTNAIESVTQTDA